MDFPSRKRIKLDADKSSSSDPFIVLHNDLHDLIYQHLRCKDVCELFKVSKEWNSRTIESPKGMKKIQLNFREHSATDPSPKSVTALLKSQRMYKNIKFSLRFAANAHRKFLILQRFSQSVTLLDIIIDTTVDFTKFVPPNLSFPKLKELRYEGKMQHALFKNFKTLEKLFVFFESFDDDFLGTINHLHYVDTFDFIKDNNNLKDLVLYNPPKFIFQKRSFYDVSWKLESLSMNLGYFPNTPQNFHDFLLFHSETLTSLRLNYYGTADTDIILTKLPALKKLEVCKILEVSKVQSNKSVSSLKCNCLCDARRILESLKGIKNVEVYDYSEDDFRWVIKNVMQLKKLKFKHQICYKKPDFATIIAAYNQFKVDDAPVNEDIEIVVE